MNECDNFERVKKVVFQAKTKKKKNCSKSNISQQNPTKLLEILVFVRCIYFEAIL